MSEFRNLVIGSLYAFLEQRDYRLAMLTRSENENSIIARRSVTAVIEIIGYQSSNDPLVSCKCTRRKWPRF